MELSVVTTMYNSAPYLREFYDRISASARLIAGSYEIIFVNDGSPDGSLALAREFLEKDARVRIVDLSMNFGQHRALMTGLEHARGDKVFYIDSDLEEAPELLEEFNRVYAQEEDCDVVYGVQKIRQGDLWQRITGWLFYVIVNLLADVKTYPNITTLRLMSGRYVKSLIGFREREMYLAGLWQLTGFRQIPVYIDKKIKGKTAYTFSRKVGILINAVTSFSSKPLMLIFYAGLSISFFSGLYIIYLIYCKLFLARLPGYTSLIVSVWFLGGLILFSLGVIGLYISKTFIEVKNRPYTIIKKIYERDSDGG